MVEVDTDAAVTVTGQVAEGRVEAGHPDGTATGEVVLGTGHRYRARGKSPLVGDQSPLGRHPESRLVHGGRADGQVRMEPQSERQVDVPDVLGIGGDRQPFPTQAVLHLEPEGEGVGR